MASPVQLGPFELTEPIGQGGMATVWGGTHAVSGVPVAVKVLAQERMSEERGLFRAEARAMASLIHPRVVWILDYGWVDRAAVRSSNAQLPPGAPYLVMERATGTLNDIRTRPIDWLELRSITISVLDALAHAHARGIVHLDLKPANVLTGGLRPGPRLTDFGLARIAARAHARGHEGRSGGTPGYMAPEQFRGAWRDYGPWTDLYALGVLLWTLATGARPFPGRGWQNLMDAHLGEALPDFQPRRPMPEGLDDWLRTCLAKDPAHRFQTAASAARALTELHVERLPVLDSGMPSEGALAPTTLLLDRPSRSVTRERFPEPGPIPRGVARASRLRVPRRWAPGRTEPPPMPLVGTGLALFGLREIPVVGRVAERDALWASLRRVGAEGGVRAVVLRGPSGSGKSRLARWLCERAHEVGVAERLEARHSPIPGPRDGVGAMLLRHLACDGLDRDDTLQRIRSLLDEQAEPDEALALTELCHPTTPEERLAGVPAVRFGSAAERHAVVERALVRPGRPAVVWLDDVQWGLDALELAEGLLSRDRCSALLVLTVRDDVLAERPEEAGRLRALLERDDVEQVRVSPLDEPDLRELLGRLLPVVRPLATRLQARAAGSPLYVVQVLGHWVREGWLELTPDGFELAEGVDAWLPGDLTTLWRTRLSRRRVEGDDGAALEVAAALGLEVDLEEWTEACAALGLTASSRWAERLVRGRLAKFRRGTLVLAHSMLRDALESRARQGERWADANRACATVLEGRSGSGVAGRIGLHLVAAGAPAEALPYLLAAFDEHLDRDELHHTERVLQDWDAARAAASLEPSDLRHGEGEVRWIHLLLIGLRQPQAEARIHALWEAVAAHGWSSLAPQLDMLTGTLHKARSELKEACEAYTRAGEGFGRLQDPVAQARACKQLSECLIMVGDSAGSRAAARQGLALASGDQVTLASLHFILASVELRDGDFLAAEVRARRSIEHARRAGSRLVEAQALRVVAGIQEAQGDEDAAEATYVRARDVVGEADEVLLVTLAVNLGFLRLKQDRFADARQDLTGALAAVEGVWRILEMLSHLGLAACEAGLGSVEATQTHLSRAETLLEQSGYTDPIVPTLAGKVAALTSDAGLAARAEELVRAQRAVLDR